MKNMVLCLYISGQYLLRKKSTCYGNQLFQTCVGETARVCPLCVRERERVQSVCCVFVQITFAEQLALHFLPIALGLVKSDFKQNVFI